MPARYAATSDSFAASTRSTSGSSSDVVADRRLGEVALGGEGGDRRSRAIASSKAARGMRSRASISLPSSVAVHGAGIDARAGELVHDDVRDRAPVAGHARVERVAARS